MFFAPVSLDEWLPQAVLHVRKKVSSSVACDGLVDGKLFFFS